MIDLNNVHHVRFAVLAADFRERSRNLEYPPEIAEDFGWIADHLETAAVAPTGDLVALHASMVAGRPPQRGGFARLRAAEIIDDYLMEMEAIAARKSKGAEPAKAE
ncbi:hypothetical protein [Devosia nitrariae]|uniref:Uncharacterized protein n=1 Tax=Devosia nitrariae TaxID=2071872 RepID=A0ABQ5W116_9HYPH|nr:hypothetical protein [Devosia nitrariae]GLQ53569.1 hypothetical protein GCM10010862_08280 [Devosia nitrariae]